jgi:hypothetical protein
MKSLVVVLFLVVASVGVPVLSSTAEAQDFDRDSCLRGCAWLKPIGSRSYGGWMNYNNCVSDCEKRFWAEFDDKTSELERERDKD